MIRPRSTDQSTCGGEQGSLFDATEFKPAWPTRGTKAAIALDDLLNDRRPTQPDWLERGLGWRLAAAVKELDYLGWPVESWPVRFPGRKHAIAMYRLPGDAIRRAFEMQGGAV